MSKVGDSDNKMEVPTKLYVKKKITGKSVKIRGISKIINVDHD